MVDTEDDLKNCVSVVEQGGIILYPTDTVWGIGCDALNGQAANKIYALKQRPGHKSMIVLLAEPKDVIQYVAAPHPDIIAILEAFDRPVTIIYEGALGFPASVANDDGTIAIRVTRDPFCKALIKRIRKPLISTSANISGHATPALFKEIDNKIIGGCDYVVKYRREDTTRHKSSQLAKINEDGSIEILRY